MFQPKFQNIIFLKIKVLKIGLTSFLLFSTLLDKKFNNFNKFNSLRAYNPKSNLFKFITKKIGVNQN
jgi:hypothetical protein